MDIMLGIITALAVTGLIGSGVTQMILAKKEREELYRLIKSKSLTEYSVAIEEPEDVVEDEIVEIPIDEIPFLRDEEK